MPAMTAMPGQCPGFRPPAKTAFPQRIFGRRPKSATRHEIAEMGSGGAARSYGDLTTVRDLKAGRLATAVRLKWEHNLNVLARILLNGEFTFCPIRDQRLSGEDEPILSRSERSTL